MADIKTEEIDFARAAQLLDVVHQCAGVGPKLTSLGNAAMTELTKMNDAIKVAAIEAEKVRVAEEAEKQAQRNATHKVMTDTQRQGLTPTIDPTGDPTKPDPDERLLSKVRPDPDVPVTHPSVHPADSQTATIADRRL